MRVKAWIWLAILAAATLLIRLGRGRGSRITRRVMITAVLILGTIVLALMVGVPRVWPSKNVRRNRA